MTELWPPEDTAEMAIILAKLVGKLPLFIDFLRPEFCINIKLVSTFHGDKAQVDAVLHSVDILLVIPQVFKELKKMAPAILPIFNVFDRVDPMSLRVLKDKLQRRVPVAAE